MNKKNAIEFHGIHRKNLVLYLRIRSFDSILAFNLILTVKYLWLT